MPVFAIVRIDSRGVTDLTPTIRYIDRSGADRVVEKLQPVLREEEAHLAPHQRSQLEVVAVSAEAMPTFNLA